MIITEKVFIKMTAQVITKFREKGYLCDFNEIVEVRINDLSKGSHTIIESKCDICGKNKNLSYKAYNDIISNGGYYCCSLKCSKLKKKATKLLKYGDENYYNIEKCKETCLNRYGCENVSLSNKIQSRREKTFIKKYGVNTPFKSEDIKDRIKKTNIEKYGCENVFSSKEIIEKINIKRGKIRDSSYILYKNKVRNYTNSNKKELFENWNGFDYYDNEFIKDNFSLNSNNKLYPTIDHKISIYYGFIKNISPKEIGDIKNLCLTKRYINSTKNKKTENEFK